MYLDMTWCIDVPNLVKVETNFVGRRAYMFNNGATSSSEKCGHLVTGLTNKAIQFSCMYVEQFYNMQQQLQTQKSKTEYPKTTELLQQLGIFHATLHYKPNLVKGSKSTNYIVRGQLDPLPYKNLNLHYKLGNRR